MVAQYKQVEAIKAARFESKLNVNREPAARKSLEC